MRTYRTKSGKVEEKLQGVNATVNPSEKAQIAMAGGADTLKDVQTILGHEGKRNNLKGQGAKAAHLVSFDHSEDESGSSYSPGTPADPGQDPEEGEPSPTGTTPFTMDDLATMQAGSPSGGPTGGGPDGGRVSPLVPDLPQRTFKTPSQVNKEFSKARDQLYSSRASRTAAKQALLDIDKDERKGDKYNEPGASVLTTKQDVKDRVADSWKDWNALRTKSEAAFDVRTSPYPTDVSRYLSKKDQARVGPLTARQQQIQQEVVNERRTAYATKSLSMAKKAAKDSWVSGIPGVEESIGFNPKTDKYGVKTDPSGLLIGGLTGLAAALAPGLIPALATPTKAVDIGYSVYGGVKALTKPEGIPSSTPRYQGYLTDRPDYPDMRIQSTSPPPPSDSGDTKPPIPKIVKSVSNKVTLAAIKPEDKRASRGRLREWRSRGISF
jgi:hypothetical protein